MKGNTNGDDLNQIANSAQKNFDNKTQYMPIDCNGLTCSITSPIVSVNRTGLCGVLAAGLLANRENGYNISSHQAIKTSPLLQF